MTYRILMWDFSDTTRNSVAYQWKNEAYKSVRNKKASAYGSRVGWTLARRNNNKSVRKRHPAYGTELGRL